MYSASDMARVAADRNREAAAGDNLAHAAPKVLLNVRLDDPSRVTPFVNKRHTNTR
jgi:hypothetical protein